MGDLEAEVPVKVEEMEVDNQVRSTEGEQEEGGGGDGAPVRIVKEHKFKFAKMEEPFQGSLEPIKIFPEEIWGILLTDFSTTDRLNVCRTHSQLDTMFGENKSQWLLVQVLPFLMKYITRNRHLLKCRTVCKEWRRIIDTFLVQDHPNRRAFDKDNLIDQINSQKASAYSTLGRCQLDYHQFTPRNVRKYLTCPEEVLIGRAISVLVNGHWSEEEVLRFWEATKQFLKSHGEHILHFKFVQSNTSLTSAQIYMILYEALQLLPKLRSFIFRYRHNQPILDKELETAIQSFHLPPLSELHSMEIGCVPRSLQEHFFKQYGAQLDKASLDLDMESYAYNEPLSLNLKVKELQLKSVIDANILEKIYCMTPSSENLSKLTLYMSSYGRLQGPLIATALKKFSKLNQLRIHIQSRICFESVASLMNERLPTVEYFELEGDWRVIFYFSAFLYTLPSLEYLHIRDTSVSYPANSEEFKNVRENRSSFDEEVEIQEYLLNGKIHLSPIWDTLPHLKIFTFEAFNRNKKVFCNRETVKYLRKGEELKGKDERNQDCTSGSN